MAGPNRFLGVSLKVWAIVPASTLALVLFFTFAPRPLARQVADGIGSVVLPPIHWLQNRQGLPQLRFDNGPDVVKPAVEGILAVALAPGGFVIGGANDLQGRLTGLNLIGYAWGTRI